MNALPEPTQLAQASFDFGDFRKCTVCHEVKPAGGFNTVSKSNLRLRAKCKACVALDRAPRRDILNAARRDYYRANKDRLNQYGKGYYAANREKASQRWKRYYRANKQQRALYALENKERFRERKALHYKKHETEYRQSLLRWKRENPDGTNANSARRRAAKHQATPAWADHKKVREFYAAARFLSMVTGDWYHVDHIVPLKSPYVCGLHWEGNLQVITGKENRKKLNRFWPDMASTEVA